jgi:hypothetical protein
VTPEDFERAEELLRDPDGEDCERFSRALGGGEGDLAALFAL